MKLKPSRLIIFGGLVIVLAALLFQSYLAFHRQVYDNCVLAAKQGTIQQEFRATCIQVGALDER